jgi:hypothetical protein
MGHFFFAVINNSDTYRSIFSETQNLYKQNCFQSISHSAFTTKHLYNRLSSQPQMRLIFGFFVAVLLMLSIENGRTASISGVHNHKDKLGVEPTTSNLKEDEESETMVAFLKTLSQEQLDLLDLETDSFDEQQVSYN